ncbi:coiled-coil domain-containing protein 142 isoform X2 [Rhinatrema bivittatum]|nr:coiled-coil domain-containing protein 142 isoform X2 [Rhinatrema bivittatum]
MSWMSESGGCLPPPNFLVAQKKAAPADVGNEEGEDASASGSASLMNVTKSLRRNPLHPSVKCCLYPHSEEISLDSQEEKEVDSLMPDVHHRLSSGTTFVQVEQSLLGLDNCLFVQRNPITKTLQVHVKPMSVDSLHIEFYHHAAYATLGQRCAKLHALIWQRHHLMLAREYISRLKSASDFIQKLAGLLASDTCVLAAQQHSAVNSSRPSCGTKLLKTLCEELQVHTSHWRILQRTIRRDRWLRPLFLQKPCAIEHMKRTFALLSLRAIYLSEQYIDVLLQYLVLADVTDVSTDLLADIFQGVEIYNQVVSDRAAESKDQMKCDLSSWAFLGQEEVLRSLDNSIRAYPVSRVLKTIPGMRGRLTAEAFYRSLLQQDPLISRVRQSCLDGMSWDKAKMHLLQGNLSSTSSATGKRSRLSRPKLREPQQMKTCPLPCDQLQAICKDDKQLMHALGEVLVSSPYSLWQQGLNEPKLDRPLTEEWYPQTSQEASEGHPSTGEALGDLNAIQTEERSGSHASSVWMAAHQPRDSVATQVLCAQFRALRWTAFGAHLFDQFYHRHNAASGLGSLSQYREDASWAVVQMLEDTLRKSCVPEECEAEIKNLCLRLLVQAAVTSWDRGFSSALGFGVNDKCAPEPSQADGIVRSRTAGLLLDLFQPLEFLLQCLDSPWNLGTMIEPAFLSLRLAVLSRCLTTIESTCFWVMTKAYQYLSSWSLNQFLLVTQADLMLFHAEIEKLVALVKAAFPGDTAHSTSLQEAQLCLKIHAAASNIKRFLEEVLQMFTSDCRRMSTDLFQQIMPMGKHWRARLPSAEVVNDPSEYAVNAAHSVIGQVLKGIWPLSQDAQITVLTHVVTVFMEAWMDHILQHKIKFSLQGALQLKNDFDMVRDMIQSQDSGLSSDIRQAVLSLRVFHQVDNAIICLLQQPPSKKYMPSPVWEPFHICCSAAGRRTREFNNGSLNSLESLEVQASRNGASLEAQTSATADLLSKIRNNGNPECYLTVNQQEWLSLRLHSGRRWKVPSLPCMNRTPET